MSCVWSDVSYASTVDIFPTHRPPTWQAVQVHCSALLKLTNPIRFQWNSTNRHRYWYKTTPNQRRSISRFVFKVRETALPLFVRHASFPFKDILPLFLFLMSPAWMKTKMFPSNPFQISMDLFPRWNESVSVTVISLKSTISPIIDSTTSFLIGFSSNLNGYPDIILPLFPLDKMLVKFLKWSI